MTVLPMFPLGTVLLPTVVIPLHVFEPRYRALVEDCLEGEQRFGVVLIERGSEVGGGDVRTDVGTIAQILEVSRFDDGRYAVAAVGTDRIRVVRWLDDDPYPRAEAIVHADPAPRPGGELRSSFDAMVRDLRRLLARSAEMGGSVPPATTEIVDDAVLATYQAAALAPVGPIDKQRLLAAPTPEVRVELLATLVGEALATLDELTGLDGDGDLSGG